MTKVTIALSRKVSDNNYGSFEATVGLEDEVPEGADKSSHAAATRAWCKAFLDETLGDMREEYLSTSPIEKPYVDINAALSEAEVGGEWDMLVTEEVDASLPNAPKVATAVQDTAQQMETPPQETRVPIDDAGNELRQFIVQSFEVAETANGDKFLKVFGGPWKRPWVPAWGQVAGDLYGDIETMDLGVIAPPFPMTAFVRMGEYKGRPSPDQVVEFRRL